MRRKQTRCRSPEFQCGTWWARPHQCFQFRGSYTTKSGLQSSFLQLSASTPKCRSRSCPKASTFQGRLCKIWTFYPGCGTTFVFAFYGARCCHSPSLLGNLRARWEFETAFLNDEALKISCFNSCLLTMIWWSFEVLLGLKAVRYTRWPRWWRFNRTARSGFEWLSWWISSLSVGYARQQTWCCASWKWKSSCWQSDGTCLVMAEQVRRLRHFRASFWVRRRFFCTHLWGLRDHLFCF